MVTDFNGFVRFLNLPKGRNLIGTNTFSSTGLSRAQSKDSSGTAGVKSTIVGCFRRLVTFFFGGGETTEASDPDFGKGFRLADFDESFFAKLEDGQKRDNDAGSTFFSDK